MTAATMAPLQVWRDRARAARLQQMSYQAAANAFYDSPSPAGDTWHPVLRRALGQAEQTKADAAGEYAEQADLVVGQTLADLDHQLFAEASA